MSAHFLLSKSGDDLQSVQLKRQHQQRLEQDLQKRRSTMDEFQHRKDVNDVSGTSKNPQTSDG